MLQVNHLGGMGGVTGRPSIEFLETIATGEIDQVQTAEGFSLGDPHPRRTLIGVVFCGNNRDVDSVQIEGEEATVIANTQYENDAVCIFAKLHPEGTTADIEVTFDSSPGAVGNRVALCKAFWLKNPETVIDTDSAIDEDETLSVSTQAEGVAIAAKAGTFVNGTVSGLTEVYDEGDGQMVAIGLTDGSTLNVTFSDQGQDNGSRLLASFR